VTGVAATRRTFRFAEVHGTQLADRAITAIDAVRLGRDGQPNAKNSDPAPRSRSRPSIPSRSGSTIPFFRF
jgi:hypothetical protein